MQDEYRGLGIAEQILEMEERRDEENRRFNAEREILLARAPDKWKELKDAFRAECGRLTERSRRLQFECEDLNRDTLRIRRFYGDASIPVVDFFFETRVPRIRYEIHLGNQPTGSIDFLIAGNNVFFASGTSGVILAEFVAQILLRITR